MAMLATAISVAAMIITLSMVNGFQQAVSKKVYSFWGHVRVQALEPLRSSVSEESNFENSDTVETPIKSMAGVAHYQAFAIKSLVLRTAGNFEGVLLKGVDAQFAKQPFSFITQGRSINFADSGYSKDLLLSEALALQLQAKIGDTVQCFFIRNGADIRTRPLTICGLYKTGIEDYDNSFALADLRFLRRLNLWDTSQIGGYELWLKDPSNSDSIAVKLNDALPQGISAVSIRTLYPNIFDWLAVQNQTKLIVIIIMTVVATINLVTCLLILVMERTRMVGMLKAMGLSNRGIKSVFWYYAVWIAVLGTGIGLLFGLGICWLQQATGFIKMDESTYYVSEVPVQMIPWQIAAVVVFALISCFLWLRLPLLFVNKISPIKAAAFK